MVLRFDALTPTTRNIEERRFQPPQPTRKLGRAGPRLEARQRSIGTVEVLQRGPMVTATGEELGAVAGDLPEEERVIERLSMALRVIEKACGPIEVAELTSHDPRHRDGASEHCRVVSATREIEGAVSAHPGPFDVATIHGHLAACELEQRQSTGIGHLLSAGDGGRDRLLRGVPPLEVDVQGRQLLQRPDGTTGVPRRVVRRSGLFKQLGSLGRAPPDEGERGEVLAA